MKTTKIICSRALIMTFISVLIISFAFTLSAQFAGGDGSEENPYIITTAEHLNNVRTQPRSHFLLRADINLDEAPWNEGQGWQPIGEGFDGFNGVFDGAGYTINGLFINRPETNRVGLFERVCGRNGPALVKNLHLTNISVTGNDEVGGLVGSMLEAAPGIVGCGVTGRVIGRDKVGGLIGDALRCAVSDNYVDGSVEGNNRVGGLIGTPTDTPIERSYSRGSVAGNVEVGGLAGYNLRSAVRNCYSTSSVHGTDQIGGLLGYSRDNNQDAREIFHCYSAGRVTGETRIGGFVGNHLRAVNVTFIYWDTQTSGLDNSPIGEGRPTAQMTFPYGGDPRTYAQWDFEEIWVNDETGAVNNGYPYLYFQSSPPAALHTPVVIIDITELEGSDVVRLRWEAVENAVSYKVFAADDLSAEDWGDPVTITEQTEYIGELEVRKFYFVVASTDEMP